MSGNKFVFVCCICAALAGARFARGADRGVHALVVGVSDYDDGRLPHATENAKAFADVIKGCYDNVDLRYLTDKAADIGNVTGALNQIGSAPADSLLIFYFAGHGEREPAAGNGSSLFLRLSNTTHANYMGNAILFDGLIPSLLRSHGSTVMIVLDCCFAGEAWSASEDLETRFKQARIRAFMLSASSSSEVAVKGIFTKAMLQTWNKAKAHPQTCWTPAKLFEETRNEMKAFDGWETMTPNLDIGRNLIRCIADLSSPSDLLVFTFPNGCKYPIKFHFPSGSTERYDPAREPDLETQIAKPNTKLNVTATLGEGDTEIWTGEVDPKNAKNNVIDVPVTFKDPRYSNPDNRAAYFAMAATADAVKDYGSNPSEYYYRAGVLALKAFPEPDVGRFSALALRYSPDNLMYKIAVESSQPSATATGIKVKSTEMNAFLSAPNQGLILKQLENVGAFAAASELREQLADRSADPETRKFQLFRAALSAKAGRNDQRANNLASRLAEQGLSDSQTALVARVRASTATELVANISTFPELQSEWSVGSNRRSSNPGGGGFPMEGAYALANAAARKLNDATSYSWVQKVENAGGGGGVGRGDFGGLEGKTENGGITMISQQLGDTTRVTYRKGDKVVTQNSDGEWMTPEEMAAARGDGGGQSRRGGPQQFRLPGEVATDLISKATGLTLADGAITGQLPEDAVKPLLAVGGRSRRGNGGNPFELSNAKGTLKVWTNQGLLSKFEYRITGTISAQGADRDVDRTTTVEFNDIGKTKIDVPDDAKKKLG